MFTEPGLQTYLRQIGAFQQLSAERERELARRQIRDNDAAAREEMIVSNLRLVVAIAKRYANRGLGVQDLIEEGNIGLLKAVEGFNPEMNVRFATYAAWWIKQAIRRALIRAAQPFNIPGYMVEEIIKWKRAYGELQDQLGRAPEPEEIGRHLRLSSKKARMIYRAVLNSGLSRTGAGEEGGMMLEEILCDERTRAPDEMALNADAVRMLGAMLTGIEAREAMILRMRYGLEDREALTLTQIGELVGLTRERVRQIEQEALEKLGRYVGGEGLVRNRAGRGMEDEEAPAEGWMEMEKVLLE